MNLEKKLAEMEVLSEAIKENASEELNERNYSIFLDGILTEAREITELRRKAYRRIRKQDANLASHYTSGIALELKNMAENLNKFMQSVYGDISKDNGLFLKNLEINTQKSPRLDNGESFYGLFTRIHNSKKDAPVMRLRNSKGHAEGHRVLIEGEKRYSVQTSNGPILAEEWIDQATGQYFSMVNIILYTMLEKDKERFQTDKTGSINSRRFSNYISKHKRTAGTIAATVLLTTGFVGGYLGNITWQNYQAKQETKKELELSEKELSSLVYAIESKEGIRSTQDNWEGHLVREKYIGLIEKAIEENDRLFGPKSLNPNNGMVQNYFIKKEMDRKN